MAIDVLEMMRSGMEPSMRAMVEPAKQRYQTAREDAVSARRRAEALTDVEDTRRYQAALDERRRRERKEDTAEDRLRQARVTLAGFLPPGTVIDPNLTEAELQSRINEAQYAQTTRRETEASKRKLDEFIAEANAKTDNELDRDADLYGVPKDLPRKDKAFEIAKAKLDRVSQLQFGEIEQNIARAKATPQYATLKAELEDIARREDKLLYDNSPTAAKDRLITGEESEALYKSLALLPQTELVLQRYDPKGYKERLAALSIGDISTAFGGEMDEMAQQQVFDSIMSNMNELTKIAESRGWKLDKNNMTQYVASMRDVPAILRQLNARRDEIFKNPIGQALQYEYGNILKGIRTPQAPVGMPGVGDATGAPAAPAPGGLPAELPEPGKYSQVTTPSNVDPYQVEGLFSGLGAGVRDIGSDLLRGAAATPALASGGQNLAGGAYNTVLQSVGAPVNNLLAAGFGGRLRDIDTAQMVTAPVQAAFGGIETATGLIGAPWEGAKRAVFDYLPRRGYDWRSPVEEEAYQNLLFAENQKRQAQNPMLRHSAAMPPIVR
jgi:hypothetical protein